MESQMIDGNEFLLDAKPIRQETRQHICVCLLIHGTPEAVALGLGREDKCKREVSNPDQAFCDGCEDEEHHLAGNQFGDARNLHKKGKDA